MAIPARGPWNTGIRFPEVCRTRQRCGTQLPEMGNMMLSQFDGVHGLSRKIDPFRELLLRHLPLLEARPSDFVAVWWCGASSITPLAVS